MGTLYVIEMPPLERQDITLRARRILEQVSVVVALPQNVQTARSRLCGCGIQSKPVEPYDQETVLAGLQAGDVALLAHTSSEIDALVQSLVKRDIPIVPIPGAVDQVTALIMSGFPTERFTFLGSLPTSRPELIAVWQSIAGEPHTVVCNALVKDLSEVFDTLRTVLGGRRVVLYQAGLIWRGNTSQAPTELEKTTNPVILVIESAGKQIEVWSEEKVRTEIKANLKRGASARDIAHEIAVHSGWKKRQIYAMATKIKAGSHPDH